MGYLAQVMDIIAKMHNLRRRGMADGVRYANLERRLREINARADAELFGH